MIRPMTHVDVEQRLVDEMRRHGMRITMARREICRILAHNEKQFLTVTSILQEAEEGGHQLELSTVYRTLDELEKIGLVNHVHFGSGTAGTWHLALDQNHHHLVCENCGKTIEISVGQLESAFEGLRSEFGFRPNVRHFTILGHCRECDDQDATSS